MRPWSSSDPIGRRRWLKTSSAVLAGGTLAGCTRKSEPERRAQTTVESDGETVSATTSNGRIEDVSASASGTFEWVGHEFAPDIVGLELQTCTDPEGEFEVIAEHTHDSPEGTTGEIEFDAAHLTGRLVRDGPWKADTFRSRSPGETQVTEVPLRVYGETRRDGTLLTSSADEHTLTVEVTHRINEEGDSEIQTSIHAEIIT